MTTLNDLLRRVPLLAIMPIIAWAFGMTVYTVQWKTQIDWQIAQVVAATTQVARQTERLIALEQSITFLREDIQELKASSKENTK